MRRTCVISCARTGAALNLYRDAVLPERFVGTTSAVACRPVTSLQAHNTVLREGRARHVSVGSRVRLISCAALHRPV